MVSPVTASPLSTSPLEASGQTLNAAKIQEATAQFEAVMVRQFLDEALKPMIEGALPSDGPGSEMIRYWTTDSLAQAMSKQSVFGLSSVLQQQLQPTTLSTPSS